MNFLFNYDRTKPIHVHVYVVFFLKEAARCCRASLEGPVFPSDSQEGFFSSPEHEVLMVSYCGQWLSFVRRRASCDVRRPSSVNI